MYFIGICSDSIQSEQTRSSSENLPFSISRLLSKPYENNNKSPTSDRDANAILLDAEHAKFTSHLANAGIPYSTASALYSSYSPFYSPGQVLRVPPQRTPLTWALPPLHPAALAHQAVKDRLAGESIPLHFWFLPCSFPSFDIFLFSGSFIKLITDTKNQTDQKYVRICCLQNIKIHQNQVTVASHIEVHPRFLYE